MKIMHTAIMNAGYLSRTELQQKAGNLAITKYNQLKSYFEEEFQDTIAYSKHQKIWYSLNPVDEEKKKELVIMELIKND